MRRKLLKIYHQTTGVSAIGSSDLDQDNRQALICLCCDAGQHLPPLDTRVVFTWHSDPDSLFYLYMSNTHLTNDLSYIEAKEDSMKWRRKEIRCDLVQRRVCAEWHLLPA